MMELNIDGVIHKIEDLSPLAKHCVEQLQSLNTEEVNLQVRLEHIEIIKQAYIKTLRDVVPVPEEAKNVEVESVAVEVEGSVNAE
jgi:hemoglobin-like flavoprotein